MSDHQWRDSAATAMLLIIFILLVVRVASTTSTATKPDTEQGKQSFLNSLGPISPDVASDASELVLEDRMLSPCRCVPADCCQRRGGMTLTSAQTDGVGSLEERSGFGSGGVWCLRKGIVCCPSGDVVNTGHCGQNGTVDSSDNNRCGTRESVASHGGAVSPGQFPWFVTVWGQHRNSLLGAGALIHPRLVITATHIVEDVPADSLLVRLGIDGKELAVAEVRLHNEWGGRARYHDLTVLRLESPAPISSAVLPACLGPAFLDPNDPFRLTGCQTVQIVKDPQAFSLRASDVQLLSRIQCETGLKGSGKLPDTFGLHYSFICAKTAPRSESACRTESGAPLTCDDPDRPGHTVLVGVLSWNAACRGLLSWPDVYTRIADIDNFCWLNRIVTSMLGEERPYFDEPLCM